MAHHTIGVDIGYGVMESALGATDTVCLSPAWEPKPPLSTDYETPKEKASAMPFGHTQLKLVDSQNKSAVTLISG